MADTTQIHQVVAEAIVAGEPVLQLHQLTVDVVVAGVPTLQLQQLAVDVMYVEESQPQTPTGTGSQPVVFITT